MEDKLNSAFENVNNWLRYAETKSATLLAANGVMVFGIMRFLTTIENEPLILLVYLAIVIFMLIASMVLLLISFSPSLDIPWLFKLSSPDENTDNLLYFDHVSKYTPKKYLEALACAAEIQDHKSNQLELMLAKQIIANSVIARRKFIIFKIAIWLTISAVITPILAWVIKDKTH